MQQYRNMTKAVLVLVCKRPAPGIGKQRLVASFGSETAQQVANALLACALEDASAWPGPVVIAPADVNDIDWAQALAAAIRSLVIIVPQSAGNLGERLNALDKTLRAQGMERLVFIGSDAPGLVAADYVTVCAALQRNDVVLIPALDGGVVLMANRSAWPDLSALPWSSEHLESALRDACGNSGQSVSVLKESYDVDQPGDVMKLVALLQEDGRPARRALHELVKTLTFQSMRVNNV